MIPSTTPDAPAVNYDCETDQLVITGADDTDTVDYTVTVDQAPNGEASTWTVTISATPQPGYRFPADAVTEWTFTDTVDCLTTPTPPIPTTPDAPAVNYDCDTDQLVITGANDTDTVDYTVTVDQAPNGEASTWTVTISATPQPGYRFPADADDRMDLHRHRRLPHHPAHRRSRPRRMRRRSTTTVTPTNSVITGADDTDTVDYTVTVDQAPNGEASTWTVTISATPQPGYRFPPDAVTEWTFTDTVDCLTTTTPPIPPIPPILPTPPTPPIPTTPDAPAVNYDCETDQLVITGANDTDTVDYTVTVDQAPNGEASTWTVTISATPQPGYRFPADAVTEWTFTDTVDCLTTTTGPAVPQLVCQLAPDRGLAVQLPAEDTYTYELTGSLDVGEDQPYEVVVVAVPASGYEFPADAVTDVDVQRRGAVPTQRCPLADHDHHHRHRHAPSDHDRHTHPATAANRFVLDHDAAGVRCDRHAARRIPHAGSSLVRTGDPLARLGRDSLVRFTAAGRPRFEDVTRLAGHLR